MLHLAGLTAVAIAQPVYDLLGRHAEVLVAHGTGPGMLLGLVAFVSFALPAALALLVGAVGRLHPGAGAWLLHLAVAALVALAVLPTVRAAPWPVATVFALAGGVGLALARARVPALRRFLTVLSASALLFPTLFLGTSPVRELLRPPAPDAAAGARAERDTPVVMLVLDELPLASLLRRDGRIDERRYPHFAALAAESHWFRNATSVAQNTTYAVPALLTGRYPDGQKLPTFAAHPDNLFLLLGRAGYRLNVHERLTRLCPPGLCEGYEARQAAPERFVALADDVVVLWLHRLAPVTLAHRLPDVSGAWSHFGRRGDAPEGDDPRENRDVVGGIGARRLEAFLGSLGSQMVPICLWPVSHWWCC